MTEGLLKDNPEFSEFIKDSEDRLRNSARLAITRVITQTLSDGDVTILSLMGIDGKQKLLDVLIEECQKLKEEP
jgi:hypothetical protein